MFKLQPQLKMLGQIRRRLWERSWFEAIQIVPLDGRQFGASKRSFLN
jgi:hypothetical protein